ncbi:MAG: lipid-binding SYLF domain-containing protein [Pirellulales bacterium]|nr:lipid-binding SYLF domain-containing protein [Pirellulales bacterium]
MRRACYFFAFAVECCLANSAHSQFAAPQPPESSPTEGASIVDSATNVLNEIMAIPAQGIPRALLRDAQGIAVVPSMIKGGFVVGVRHGRGIVIVKDDNGNWRAPSFITITGGSVGWQAGVQATDIVLVFKTKKSIQGLLNGKFTIGGGVSAAAGPVGREASAATDATLRAEIYSYSRSRGLFAGAAVDGSMISLDNTLTAAYYRGSGMLQADGPPGQPARLPPSADRFMQNVAAFSQPEGAVVPTPELTPAAAIAPGTPPTVPPTVEVQAIRSSLADSSRKLQGLLDQNWQRYLALPPEIYSGNQLPPLETVGEALARYEKVVASPNYGSLSQRPEFQETLGLLKSYRELQAAAGATKNTLTLPPPPM